MPVLLGTIGNLSPLFSPVVGYLFPVQVFRGVVGGVALFLEWWLEWGWLRGSGVFANGGVEAPLPSS